MMTKKDFISLADTIRDHNNGEAGGKFAGSFSSRHLTTLTRWCQQQNPQFNKQKWLDYLHGKCGPNGGMIK